MNAPTHSDRSDKQFSTVEGFPYEYRYLSEGEKRAWRACELHGLRPKELAQYEDVNPSTVRTQLSRAREKIGGEQ